MFLQFNSRFTDPQLQPELYSYDSEEATLEASLQPPADFLDFPEIAPDFSNLHALIADAHSAREKNLRDISIPKKFYDMMTLLIQATKNLSGEYQKKFAIPLLRHLNACWGTYKREGGKEQNLHFSEVELDAIRALLLNGKFCPRLSSVEPGAFCRATEAAQEVVSDFYDEFVRNIDAFPRGRDTPSVHTWKKEGGPATYPIQALERLGIRTAIVTMPLVNALGGLLAWTTFAHEVAGHNNLHSGVCLKGELQQVLRNSLISSVRPSLANYWASRADETIADVLGTLNLGPAAGIGLVGYFRGLSVTGRLRATGPAGDEHPSDLIRGLLAAKVIRQLNFSNAWEWANALEKEVLKDYPMQICMIRGKLYTTYAPIKLGDREHTFMEVLTSVDEIATNVLHTKLKCLGDQSLFELRAWNQNDMDSAHSLMTHMKTGFPIDGIDFYKASHIISAATFAALEEGADVPEIFNRMIGLLKMKHDFNPHWDVLV